MPTITTEGIIVKRSNFGEADRILTVITPYKGKIRVMAKGVRKITSRRGGSIEMLNKVRMQLYIGKNMSILTEAQTLETFPKIKADLNLTGYGSHIVELTERLLPEEQTNPEAYKLLVTVLTLMDKQPRQLWIRAFEVKLLATLGFWSPDQLQTNNEVKVLLDDLQKKEWIDLVNLQVSEAQALELERVLRYYMERVLESPLRSVQVMRKMKNG
ncbi:DNA repair protein RecO [Candidatus Daviesbacteria bacterium RIFCSPHIGHO2_02_FULL_41_14]|uniref:DNA repair protein RecO n=1 Tax=Candidatus Daviesbacteria bacterium RIFCSPLOWO2_01_FULL_40_24 TaxID=1797787 RepID=A0A1F5MJA2_9BACT|nr:MAG: DNA repair protein RecO [Candidatus Daviesbacteria bacterium RIFCSPHIGHO2_02_FULL_41_14]OGE65409.1 MAG: DNA repair protein RecO [Candidatus Daviesbacteria bacterium RIFCSPLOWO2_01_FULL_40_24]